MLLINGVQPRAQLGDVDRWIGIGVVFGDRDGFAHAVARVLFAAERVACVGLHQQHRDMPTWFVGRPGQIQAFRQRALRLAVCHAPTRAVEAGMPFDAAIAERGGLIQGFALLGHVVDDLRR